jgi:hypothetical protein
MKSLLFYLVLVPFISLAQPLVKFNEERLQTDQNLMLGLGSWAVTNSIVSGIGWATVPKGEAHYFHQMNVMWNTVNLALAIPGYLKAKKANSGLTFSETIKAQHTTEKIFLINTGLDVGYMTGGFLLRSAAKTNSTKQDQFNGYGNSLLMQGGFLFVFDLTAYMIHKRHAKRSLDKLLNSVEVSTTGLSLQWGLESKVVWAKKQFL